MVALVHLFKQRRWQWHRGIKGCLRHPFQFRKARMPGQTHICVPIHKWLETCAKAAEIFGLSPDMDTKMASCWDKQRSYFTQHALFTRKSMSHTMQCDWLRHLRVSHSPRFGWSCCPDLDTCWGKSQIKHWDPSRLGFGRCLHWLPNPEDLQKLPADAWNRSVFRNF